MLKELIEMLSEGQVHTQRELAKRLGVSQGLIEQMLQDLSRLGYIQRTKKQPGTSCAACPMARLCASEPSERMWTVTSKIKPTRVNQ